MSDSRPNILLIMTDQQRGDCIGLDPCSPSCLQTPNLDWIARTGTHFHRGYSECPSCIPARRCLMTGTAPAANGVVGFKSAQWHPPHTLAGELSRAGYQTEMIGKLHLNPKRKRYGFDHMQLADATRGDHNLFRKTWPYEASARIPFLIRAPKKWGYPEEITCKSPVGIQDIMPTILDAASIDIPDTCTGKGLLPVLQGDTDHVREFLHGEHAGCYEYDHGNHYITDGHHKYIWYSQTGEEHLFNLDEDPHEMRDITRNPNSEIQPWRNRLIEFLKDRPEGFTDGTHLIPGQPHEELLPDYDPEATYPHL